MKLPYLVALDDDAQVLQALTRDLRNQYRKQYRVLSTESAHEGLSALQELKNRNEPVAMLISDQRMPEMLGVDFLAQAKKIFPEAKKVLLTAYSDTDAAIRAINDVQLDYYLAKPWDPPEEKLYPVLTDLLADWELNFKPEYEGLRLIGYQFSPRTHTVKEFLTGALLPYQWLDVQAEERAKELVTTNKIELKDLPALFFEDGSFLVNPTPQQIAVKLGRSNQAADTVYDVVIVGAGPSGLAAAVYGASEGLKTLLVEKNVPGGQAGTSSRIENYLGFPSGLSGAELTRRAVSQALRLGAEFLSPQEVLSVSLKDGYKIVKLGGGQQIAARSLILTMGVQYRQLEATGVEKFSGAGIYYGAATAEAAGCQDRDIYIVGGGNSAGQAAVYLARFAKRVSILVRKPDLSSTMSHYLIDQIEGTPNIRVVGETEVVEACGDDRLKEIAIHYLKDDHKESVPADALFVFIGAKPNTDWLKLDLIKDEKGFIVTGRDLARYAQLKQVWHLERDPYLLETCVPGVFAAGDVRAGAMNRVASAVGEGSMAINFVHKYLGE